MDTLKIYFWAFCFLTLMLSCKKNDSLISNNNTIKISSSVSADIYFGMSSTPWQANDSSKMLMRFNTGCGKGYLAALSGNYLIEIEMSSSSSFNIGTNYNMGPNENISLSLTDISSGEKYTTSKWPGGGTFKIDTIDYAKKYIECSFNCSAYNNATVGVGIQNGLLKYKDYGPSFSNNFTASASVNSQDYFTCDPSGILYPSDSKITIKAYAGNGDWISIDIPSTATSGSYYAIPNQNVNFSYYFKTPPAPPVTWTTSGGFVNITSHDIIQNTISGTFEYQGVHPFVSPLNITQGSFNIIYDKFPY